ncbi:MAG: hypothetical protein ACR2M8_09920 [Pyrinomonadaceae bacterium]
MTLLATEAKNNWLGLLPTLTMLGSRLTEIRTDKLTMAGNFLAISRRSPHRPQARRKTVFSP